MKKRIGIAAVLCGLGLIVGIGISSTKRNDRPKEDVSKGAAVLAEVDLENIAVGFSAELVRRLPENVEDRATVKAEDVPVVAAENKVGMEVEPGAAAEEISAKETLPKEDLTDGVENGAAEEVEDSGQSENESEYVNFAIADVDNYVNVRNQPSTEGDIVGKIFDGAVAQILAVDGEQDDWFQITSGNVEGYVKAEYFLYGDTAAAVIEEYVVKTVEVQADRLNVRPEPSTDAARIGYLEKGEKVKLLEDCGEWLRVQYTTQKEGYVASEYVVVQEGYIYAKTLAEEQEEAAARAVIEARGNVTEQKVSEALSNIEFPATVYTSNEELRKAIVNYALQYVGNRYVHGGSSLANGTDCSGFTCFIYADFGYSISRTPGGQLSSAGRSIDYSQIQPGDIICYSSNGGASCTHVALYIGDGQIVHAANSRKGVIVGRADYSPIVGIKNVID